MRCKFIERIHVTFPQCGPYPVAQDNLGQHTGVFCEGDAAKPAGELTPRDHKLLTKSPTRITVVFSTIASVACTHTA